MQVRANPDALEDLAKALKGFVENIDEAVGRLQGSFNAASTAWDDPKKVEFEEVYNELLHGQARFKETASDMVPHLFHKAQKLREYLGS